MSRSMTMPTNMTEGTDVQEMTQRMEEISGRMDGFDEMISTRVPSNAFVMLAGLSIIGSLSLRIMGRKNDALFVGQWAPTFMLLGVYSKVCKEISMHRNSDIHQNI